MMQYKATKKYFKMLLTSTSAESSSTSLRYGEADFHFTICTDKSPSDWSATAEANDNGVATNIGFVKTGQTITKISSDDVSATFDAHISFKECIPDKVRWIGGLCDSSGTIGERIVVAHNDGSVSVVVPEDGVYPSGYAIFDTP